MPKPKKIRPDSKIGRLAPELRAEVDRMLVAGESARAVRSMLRDHVEDLPSETSIYQYYHAHLAQYKLDEIRSIAESLTSTPVEELNGAIRTKVLQRALEIALADPNDPKQLALIVKIVNDSEKVELLRRQLDLAERKAAALEAVKEVVKAPLTPEEKQARLNELFGRS